MELNSQDLAGNPGCSSDRGFPEICSRSVLAESARLRACVDSLHICGYNINMKAIQIMISEELLRRLDQDEEVKQSGRSAVLRRAAAEYLRRARSRRITEKYHRAYGDDTHLKSELDGWAKEGAWPDD